MAGEAEQHRSKNDSQGLKKSRAVTVDMIRQAESLYCPDDPTYLDTWWKWASGSTPFFWNWPRQYQEEVQDGQPHFLIREFDSFVQWQEPPTAPKDGEQVRKKVVLVRMKGYIKGESVISLIHYFLCEEGTL